MSAVKKKHTDTVSIKIKMLEHNLTSKDVAEKLGISKQALSYKLNNKQDFKVSEIWDLAKLLELTDGEIVRIFIMPEQEVMKWRF